MFLKKTIIRGMVSLFTVSALGFSAFNYTESTKVDEREHFAGSQETNNSIYANPAQVSKENGNTNEDDIDDKASNFPPKSQKHAKTDISEKVTPEATNKTNEHNSNKTNKHNTNTSISNPKDNVAKTDNIPNTNGSLENIPAKTDVDNTVSNSVSTNDESKNSQQGNTPAIAAATPPLNTNPGSVSTDTYDTASNNNSVNNSSKTANKENTPTITEDTAPVNTDSSNAPADTGSTNNNNYRTVSYYTDDWSTLLRVEYYDDNSKLVEYSSVTDYDKDTNSYKETVYQYDYENNVEVTTRTDTYVNGEIASSEIP